MNKVLKIVSSLYDYVKRLALGSATLLRIKQAFIEPTFGLFSTSVLGPLGKVLVALSAIGWVGALISLSTDVLISTISFITATNKNLPKTAALIYAILKPLLLLGGLLAVLV